MSHKTKEKNQESKERTVEEGGKKKELFSSAIFFLCFFSPLEMLTKESSHSASFFTAQAWVNFARHRHLGPHCFLSIAFSTQKKKNFSLKGSLWVSQPVGGGLHVLLPSVQLPFRTVAALASYSSAEVLITHASWTKGCKSQKDYVSG